MRQFGEVNWHSFGAGSIITASNIEYSDTFSVDSESLFFFLNMNEYRRRSTIHLDSDDMCLVK